MVCDWAGQGEEIQGCFCGFESLLCVEPVGFVFVRGGFVFGWRRSAVGDLLDWRVEEPGERPVDVNLEPVKFQKE